MSVLYNDSVHTVQQTLSISVINTNLLKLYKTKEAFFSGDLYKSHELNMDTIQNF